MNAVQALRARMEEAARTLRRTPLGKNHMPAGIRVAWPDVVHSRAEAYGWDAAETPRMLASSAEIADLDAVLGDIASHWSRQGLAGTDLPHDCGWVAWMRAAGWSWGRIGATRLAKSGERDGKSLPWGNSRPSLAKIEEAALAHMARRLGALVEEPEPALPEVREEVVVDYSPAVSFASTTDRKGKPQFVMRQRHASARSQLVPRGRR
jgi:hypothetical protein